MVVRIGHLCDIAVIITPIGRGFIGIGAEILRQTIDHIIGMRQTAAQRSGLVVHFFRGDVPRQIRRIFDRVPQRVRNQLQLMRRVIAIGQPRAIRLGYRFKLVVLGITKSRNFLPDRAGFDMSARRVGKGGYETVRICNRPRPPISIIDDRRYLSQSISDLIHSPRRIMPIGRHIPIGISRRHPLSGGVIGVFPSAAERTGRNGLLHQRALDRIISQGRNAIDTLNTARFRDLGRQMKGRMPDRRNRPRQRRTAGFRARQFFAACVIYIGGNIAVPISAATLGKGHVLFFYNKLGWLARRAQEIADECRRRNRVVNFDPKNLLTANPYPELYGNWVPNEKDMALNRERIALRISEFKQKSPLS